MIKKRIYIVVGYVLVATLFAFVLYTSNNIGITGFTIYTAQPDPATGKDTYLRQDSTLNYGTDTVLKIGTVSTGGGKELRTILYFNTSSIPASNTVIQANLSIYLATSATENNITLNAYRLTSDWNETNTSWYAINSSTNWTSEGGDYDSNIISSTIINQTGWYNISIDSLVRNWVNGTQTNYGVMLYAPGAGVGDSKEIYSSDYTDDITLRPQITIDHTTNAVPSINTISTDSSISPPKQIGQNVTFTVNWTDLEGDISKIYICNSSNITFTNGCEDITFCNTSLASTNPATCSYTTISSNNRTTSFWVATCDSGNCSSVSAENYFYINHNPAISLTQPNGGETVNQSLGNYSILFSVNDTDSDNLNASIYYGTTQGSTTNTIASNINLSAYCTDADSDTATTNTCNYSWNSIGIYGTYFLTIVINDSYSTTNTSSATSFDIRSIIDLEAPQITSTTIDSDIFSGKTIQINATITDDNMDTAWITFNWTSTNATMTNSTPTLFTGTFTAPAVGTYSYKVYANDSVENLNDSLSSQEFTVVKPNATAQTAFAPSTALPFSTIKIVAGLNATNALENVSAYLTIPDGFTFLNDYPQNSVMGNFATGQTQNATWFLSVPIAEATYTLNTTFTDQYSNSWDGSNFNIEVTSAVGGGYELKIAGYPEVETTDDYYVESKFELIGAYTAPDSMQIKIYDSTGSLIVGPASMTEESTGQYNYTYTVGSSANEGQWETIVNSTKSGTSYFANHFWKVVGGPFDVRNITVLNSSISDLTINVTTENTGGANKDLTLTWNLTREDTGALLDSGADTFMVPASSTRLWTVQPTTNYIGQVRITMLGYYSETEKAGAYKIFSTTSGVAAYCGDGTCNGAEICSTCPADCGACVSPPSTGGGGGGTTPTLTSSLEITDFNKIISLTKNIEKTETIEIKNTGTKTLTNITLTLEDSKEISYTVNPISISSLKPNETAKININLLVTNFTGEQDITLKIKTNELEITKSIIINSLSIKDYFLNELKRLKERAKELKEDLTLKGADSLIEELKTCEEIIDELETNIKKENFIDAQDNVENADDCINKVKNKDEKTKEIPFIGIQTNYWIWIITWILIILLIIALLIIIYLIYKKMNILNFVKKEKETTPAKTETTKNQSIEDKLKNIKERLGK